MGTAKSITFAEETELHAMASSMPLPSQHNTIMLTAGHEALSETAGDQEGN